MLVSSNYDKNYASTIYKIPLAWLLLLGDIVFRPECCDPICRRLSGIYACKLVDFGARFSVSLKDSSSASYAISYFPLIFSVRNSTCLPLKNLKLSLSPLETPSWRTSGKDAQRRMRRKGEKSYLWGSISCFVCSWRTSIQTNTNS